MRDGWFYPQGLLFGARLNRLTYLAAHGFVGAVGKVSDWLYDAGWIYASAGVSTSAMAVLIVATSRRLHDLGRSGWWQLPINGPLLALSAISPFVSKEAFKAIFDRITGQGLIAWLVCAALFSLGLILIPGRKGENRYGAPPPVFGF